MQHSEYATVLDWFNRREADAFRAIAGRHAAMVYATCRRILGNDSEAEEVAQECFEVLATVPAKQAPPREIGPWLHGVAVNRSLMRLRAEGRRRKYETRYASEQPSHAPAGWDDLRDLIDEAINELPEDLRLLAVHHFFYGQSHGEIARAAGIPRRTISNRIGKAVELVGETLRKRGLQVSTAMLAGMVLGGLSEAAAAPATVMTPLGSVAVAQGAPSSTALLAAEGAGISFLMKSALAAIGVAILLGAGLGVYQFYRSRLVAIAAPSDDRAVQTSATVNAHGQASTHADNKIAATLDAYQGETGSISGKVSDAVVTADMWLKAMETQDFPTERDLLRLAAKPRPGVEVLVGKNEEQGFVRLRSAFTDDAGQYRFPDLPPGEYGVYIVPPPEVCPWFDVRPHIHRGAAVKAREDVTVDLKIQDGLAIRGRVTDASGQAIAGVHISAVPILSDDSISSSSWGASTARVEEEARQDTVTGEDGSYEMHGIVPANLWNATRVLATGNSAGGVVQITVTANGYAPVQVYVYAVTQALAQEAKRFWVELNRRYPDDIPGEMLSPPDSVPLAACEGATLTGVNVTLQQQAGTIAGILETTRGKALPHRQLRILFAKEDNPLQKPYDSSGDGVDQSQVFFKGRPAEQYPLLPQPIQTDATGGFSFSGLAPGTYQFEIDRLSPRVPSPGGGVPFPRYPAKQRARNADVRLEAGQQVAGLRVVFEDSEDLFTLTGIVVDSGTRQPLNEYSAGIIAIDADDEATPEHGFLAKDEGRKGHFSIVGISPGIATLAVSSPGYATEDFRVDLRKENGHAMTFPLDVESILAGHVTVNGGIESHATVDVKSKDSLHGGGGSVSHETGEYEVNSLKPGAYSVRATLFPLGAKYVRYTLPRQVTLLAGQTMLLDFDFTGSASLTGTVSIPREALAFVEVLTGALPDAVPPSDSNGLADLCVGCAINLYNSESYRIAMLAPGTYTVVGSVSYTEGDKVTRLAQQVHTVTLAEDETAEFNFDFSE
ncbi:MAG: sigma-70 family RNA polymerase sigma factor [Candidatus Hydrogenedentales bacterium]|jgi:RNA polymerase sigma factor (sigma-70 family)